MTYTSTLSVLIQEITGITATESICGHPSTFTYLQQSPSADTSAADASVADTATVIATETIRGHPSTFTARARDRGQGIIK